MEASDGLFHYFGLTLEVFLIDLLLSGDNAVVIALACRSLPPLQMRRAMLIGTGGAIALRLLLTSVASLLLTIPLLKLVGGAALAAIAIKLIVEEDAAVSPEVAGVASPGRLSSAIGTIIVADAVMSLDNVVGLAAATRGEIAFLALGLLLSIPLLMFGSLFVTTLLQRYPLLIQGGGALLGWLAGDLAVTDPLISPLLSQQAPALTVLVPWLVAVFVVAESRIIEQSRATAAALRPRRRQPAVPSPVAVPPATGLASVRTVSEIAASGAADETADQSPDVAWPRAAVEPAAPAGGARSDATPARRQHSSPRFRWLAAISLVATGWVAFAYVRAHWMPQPTELQRYVCRGSDTIVYYRHGANQVRMSSAGGTVDGLMHYEEIDWGDAEKAASTLGIAPPTAIRYGDTKSVRLNGGSFAGVECFVQAAASVLDAGRSREIPDVRSNAVTR